MANRTFASLIGFALSLALLGLGANLMHLQVLMKKGNESLIQDHPYNPRVLLQDLLNEQLVFLRLVKESAGILDQCPEDTNAADALQGHSKTSHRENSDSRRRLERFGFTKALNNHLHIPKVSGDKQQIQQECTAAPSAACHVSKFTMLVTFHGESLRTLFLNLLSWVTYLEVSQILVLLPPSCNSSIHEDAKYGDRLLKWHADASHLVKLEFTSSSWILSAPIQEEAVVWMNGNIPNKANYRGLEAGLELWKRHADSVVASQGWKIKKNQSTSHTTTNAADAASLLPFCKHETTKSVIRSKDDIQIADLHYLIVHRNYLCFLSHPVLQSLHRFTSSATPSEERLAISMLLTQLSGQPPRLFPANVQSEGMPGKRKLLRQNRNYINKGTPATTSKTSSLMNIFAPRRLLQQGISSSVEFSQSIPESGMTEQVDEKVVTELVGFFGSLPRESVNWCSDCPEDVEVPMTSIPWMTEKCKAQ